MGKQSRSDDSNVDRSFNKRKTQAMKAKQQQRYRCRICSKRHPLKMCKRFMNMNIVDRIQAVRQHNYCFNCLAHEHSHGSCFSKGGCKTCKKQHHSLLHVNQRLKKDIQDATSPKNAKPPSVEAAVDKPSTSRPSTPSTLTSKTNEPTLVGFMRAHVVVLLPTAVVKIIAPKGAATARCLLDSGVPLSRISHRLVEAWGITSLSLLDETICSLQLHSRHDEEVSLSATFRVTNRIALSTPSENIPSSLKQSYQNLQLADPEFFNRSSIDIVLGMDYWQKFTIPGDICKHGLPTAMNTIFGYAICGSYNR